LAFSVCKCFPNKLKPKETTIKGGLSFSQVHFYIFKQLVVVVAVAVVVVAVIQKKQDACAFVLLIHG